MNVPGRSALRVRGQIVRRARVALTAALISGASLAHGQTTAPDAAVKAAFLYNFAKFAEWPVLPAAAPIVSCVVGDEEIATALTETVRGQTINGHRLEVSRAHDTSAWRACHLLFIAAPEARRSATSLAALKMLPVLTVGETADFASASGIVELYLEGGRVRFAINTDAASRAGLRLSSRLLGLARIVRNAQ